MFQSLRMKEVFVEFCIGIRVGEHEKGKREDGNDAIIF